MEGRTRPCVYKCSCQQAVQLPVGSNWARCQLAATGQGEAHALARWQRAPAWRQPGAPSPGSTVITMPSSNTRAVRRRASPAAAGRSAGASRGRRRWKACRRGSPRPREASTQGVGRAGHVPVKTTQNTGMQAGGGFISGADTRLRHSCTHTHIYTHLGAPAGSRPHHVCPDPGSGPGLQAAAGSREGRAVSQQGQQARRCSHPHHLLA